MLINNIENLNALFDTPITDKYFLANIYVGDKLYNSIKFIMNTLDTDFIRYEITAYLLEAKCAYPNEALYAEIISLEEDIPNVN